MIEITVNRDGTVSTPSGNVFLGNKFENLDETLSFTFPEEFQEYNKYLIGHHKRRKATVILPINNNIFYVTTGLTYLDGDWTLYAMCRQQVLDLSTDEQVDIFPKEGEHVFISDSFSATVASNNIDSSVINSTVLDQNLQPIYEELLRLKDELKNDEVIKIELSDEQMQNEASEQAIGRPEDYINIIEYKDVYINRNLFLNSDGTTKKTIYLAISMGNYETPNVYCINNSYKDDQIVNYSGSYMMLGKLELLGNSSVVAFILIDENTTQKDGNHFRIVLSQRISVLAGKNLDGFVRSIVDYDEGYTVPVAVDFDGYMFVPTYPEIPDNSYNDVFWVNIVPVEGQPGKIKVDKTKTEIGLAIQSNKKALLMDEKGEVFFFAEIGPTQSRPDDIAYSFTSYAELYQAGGIYLLQNQINVYDQDDVEHEILEVLASSYNYGFITRQDDTFTCDLTFIELAQSSQSAVYYTPDGGETCVYNRCRMSDQSETMTFQHMLTTETGIKISEFTISSDNTVTYSEKEFTSN